MGILTALQVFCQFLYRGFFFLLNFKSSLNILDVGLLSDMCLQGFSPTLRLVFSLLTMSFKEQMLLTL